MKESIGSRLEAPLAFFEEFQDLAQRTRFAVGELPPDHVEMSNPVCGDVVRLALSLDQGLVSALGYQQEGCWPVRGCLELLGQLVVGAPVAQVLAFRLEDFLALVEGVPASKRHAFSLSHRAVLSATAQALSRSAEH